MELAAQELSVVGGRFGVEGQWLKLSKSLAKAIDFHGPACLVCFLAVLRQGCCFAECVEFALEFSDVRRRLRLWLGCCACVCEE